MRLHAVFLECAARLVGLALVLAAPAVTAATSSSGGRPFGPAADQINAVYSGIYSCGAETRTFSLDLHVDAQGAMRGTLTAQLVFDPHAPAGGFALFSLFKPSAPPETSEVSGHYNPQSGDLTLAMGRTRQGEAINYRGVLLRDGKSLVALPAGRQSPIMSSCSPLIAEQGKDLPKAWRYLLDEAKPGSGKAGVFATMKDNGRKQCPDHIKRWATQLKDNGDVRQTGAFPMVRNLFSTAFFKPYFGAPFHKLSRDDRVDIAISLMGSCKRDAEFMAMLRYMPSYDLLAYAFDNAKDISYVDIAISDIAYTELHEWRVAAMEYLSALAKNDGEPAQIEELTKTASSIIATLWPKDLSEFNTHANAQRSTVVARWLERTLDSDIAQASPQSNDALLHLANFFLRNTTYFGALPAADQRTLREGYAAKMSAFLSDPAARHLKMLEGLTPGMEALIASTRWYNDNSAYFVRYPDLVPSQTLRDVLLKIRRQSYKIVAPALAAEAVASTNLATVRNMTERYVIPLDSEFDESRDVLAQIDRKSQLLQAELRAREQEQREVEARRQQEMQDLARRRQEETEKRAALEGRDEQPRDSSFDREPTEGEIYDMLKSKLASLAANVNNMADSCNTLKRGRPQDFKEDMANTMNAMTCLFSSTLKLGGSGEPIKVTRLQKIACARANSEPGWVCDYFVSWSGGAFSQMGSLFGALAQGQAAQTRFVMTPSGWVGFFGESRRR